MEENEATVGKIKPKSISIDSGKLFSSSFPPFRKGGLRGDYVNNQNT